MLFGSRRPDPEEAARRFAERRDELQREFSEKAAASGKPRGLRWKEVQFGDAVELARDRKTGALAAFAGVTISFEAVEGGPMEDVEAVGNLRAGSAHFAYDGERWQTDGRALFNLEPHEAVEYYGEQLERVEIGD